MQRKFDQASHKLCQRGKHARPRGINGDTLQGCIVAKQSGGNISRDTRVIRKRDAFNPPTNRGGSSDHRGGVDGVVPGDAQLPDIGGILPDDGGDVERLVRAGVVVQGGEAVGHGGIDAVDKRAEDALKRGMEAGAGPGEREGARRVGERAPGKGVLRRLQQRHDADEHVVRQVQEVRLVQVQALARGIHVRVGVLRHVGRGRGAGLAGCAWRRRDGRSGEAPPWRE